MVDVGRIENIINSETQTDSVENDNHYLVVAFSTVKYPLLVGLTTNEAIKFVKKIKNYKERTTDLELKVNFGSYPGGSAMKLAMDGKWDSMEQAMDYLFASDQLQLPTFVYKHKGPINWAVYNFMSDGKQKNPTQTPYDKVLRMWEKAGLKYSTWGLSHGAALKDSYYII